MKLSELPMTEEDIERGREYIRRRLEMTPAERTAYLEEACAPILARAEGS